MTLPAKNTITAFLIPLCAAALLLGYYYQNRKNMMTELAKSGISAIFQDGNVSHEDIRQYFVYPPTEEGSLLRALEVTPEDLADLDKEEASRLKEPTMQLLLSLVIQHIAIVKHLNETHNEFTAAVLEDSVKIYKHSLMAEKMEEELRLIKPEVKPEDMMQYYIKNRDEFHQDGKQLSRHLMVKQTEAGEETAVAIEIWNRIQDGEDFGYLIQHYSQSESQNRNGFLGWHPKGVLHETLENVIWNMAVHEITGPVEIEGNLHFVQLLDQQERGLMDFEESKPMIQEALEEQERMNQIYAALGIAKETVEQGNVENSLVYHTKLLEKAYEMRLNEYANIVKQVHVYEMYKKADLLFDDFVAQFEQHITHKPDLETGWRLETEALEQMLENMRFYFLVQFDLPEKEPANS